MYTLAEMKDPKIRRKIDNFHKKHAPRCSACKQPFTEAQRQAEEIYQVGVRPASSSHVRRG